jgi:hypothetical protein
MEPTRTPASAGELLGGHLVQVDGRLSPERKWTASRIASARRIGPQATKAPAVIGVAVTKPMTLIREKSANKIRSQRMEFCRPFHPKSGATNRAAKDRKKPQPRISRANITDSVE